ncbi:MAG TPA: tRNA (adenosine(37)-N6)-threonylcarbamoyltransferase complex dimerization subunit type 1 TsaB [Vicinamibacterales bacterium]
MRVLALDTTTRAGSAALVENDRIVDERAGDGSRTHAARLPSELAIILEANKLTWRDIDVYAVASGPGSFTGLRVGIATIQGLATVNSRRVVAVPALDTLAHVGGVGLAPGTLVSAWMDAYRNEVFSAAYRVTGMPPFTFGCIETIDGPAVGTPASILERWTSIPGIAPSVFVGDGAEKYATEIARSIQTAAIVSQPLLAGAIGLLALERAGLGDTMEPAAVHPLYVRRPDVEHAREAGKTPAR